MCLLSLIYNYIYILIYQQYKLHIYTYGIRHAQKG